MQQRGPNRKKESSGKRNIPSVKSNSGLSSHEDKKEGGEVVNEVFTKHAEEVPVNQGKELCHPRR